MTFAEIIVSLIIGLISGAISGFIVYIFTQRFEKKIQAYNYLETFLFDTLKECEMFIPSALLHQVGYIDDKNKSLYKAIQNVLDYVNPYGHEDKVLSDREEKISDSVMTALEELYKRKKTTNPILGLKSLIHKNDKKDNS